MDGRLTFALSEKVSKNTGMHWSPKITRTRFRTTTCRGVSCGRPSGQGSATDATSFRETFRTPSRTPISDGTADVRA